MKRSAVIAILLFSLVPLVPYSFAKTHKDVYKVSCDVLWPAVKDAVRNSGKYGIVGIDNNEMSISYVIGGTLGGKRINSVVLNRIDASSCEMQTQTAFSGLIHNDAADFKSRVESSMAKLTAAGKSNLAADTVENKAAASTPATTETTRQSAAPPAELKPGLNPEGVEKIAGKPTDKITLKDSLVYIYPTYKVFFEKNELVEVQLPEATGK